jgi:cobalamin biosynthesis protein CobD/CbiB
MSWAWIKDRVGLLLTGLVGAAACWALSNALGGDRVLYTVLAVWFVYTSWENKQLRKEIRRLQDEAAAKPR